MAQATPVGGEFRVNAFANFQQRAAIGVGGDGDFVVTWESYSQDGAFSGIFARRFAAAGNPQAGEFQVNTRTAGTQDRPAVAIDRDGAFVVAWVEYYGIFGRRFDSAGAPQAGEFQVNTYTDGFQRLPDVASRPRRRLRRRVGELPPGRL